MDLATQAGSGHPVSKPQVSLRRRSGEFIFFLLLFATYDAVICLSHAASRSEFSLINYIVRDGRTDESAMYWPFIREAAEGRIRTTDPYLVEHQRSRDIKPRLPTLLGAAVLKLVGNANLAVLLIHTLFPALGAMLLVEISTPFLGRNAAFAISILSVAGLAFAFNELAVALRVTDLGGPHKYNAIEHLYRGSGLHIDFQRFFSPGLTLAPFLLGVGLLLRDAKLKKRRTLILAGLLLGLHTEIYIHGGVTFAAMVASLIGLNWLRERTEVAPGKARLETMQRLAWFSAATVLAALPWLIRYRSFRRLQYAEEIMFRVGNFDFTPDIYRLPMLTWTFLAIYLRHVAALRAAKRRPENTTSFLNNPLDLIWTAIVLTVFGAGWLAGIAGDWGFFPCSHLVTYRYLGYLAPLLAAYPAGLLLQQEFEGRSRRQQLAVSQLGAVTAALLTLVIVFGEVRAAQNCAKLYAITPQMAFVRDQVIPATKPRSVIMTEDLRLTSYLVCESDRKTYIGYASVSLAPTGELIDRLMIPSILLGRTFEEFEKDHYQAAWGLPQGPSGQHWVLHHGGDRQPVPQRDLAARYQGLQKLSAEDLFRRYRFDYAYFPDQPPVAPYAARLKLSKVPGLYEPQGAK